MHNLNLHSSEPTKGALATMVRRAAARDLGVAPQHVKEPWSWSHVRDFTATYCAISAAESQFIITLMAATMFVCACRFDDARAITWASTDFSRNGFMILTFSKRKHDQFRKGSSVTIPEDDLLDPNLPVLFIRWRNILQPKSDHELFSRRFHWRQRKGEHLPCTETHLWITTCS